MEHDAALYSFKMTLLNTNLKLNIPSGIGLNPMNMFQPLICRKKKNIEKITLILGPPPVPLAKYGWCIASPRASNHPYFGSINGRSALPIAYLYIYSNRNVHKNINQDQLKVEREYWWWGLFFYIPNTSKPMSN